MLRMYPAFSPGRISLIVHMNLTSTTHLLLGLYALYKAKDPSHFTQATHLCVSYDFLKGKCKFSPLHTLKADREVEV